MRLPNGEQANVDIRKLLDYCLNHQHPRGRNKARVFASVGIREAEVELLRTALLAAARDGDAVSGEDNPYGKRYVIDFTLNHGDRAVKIRSAWIVASGEELPRLTTCYVL